MKTSTRPFQVVNIFLALVILTSLLVCRLADSNCYPNIPGKKHIMKEQFINGIDCFTGKFVPPKILPANYPELSGSKYGWFNFDRFRMLYLTLFGLVVLNILFLLWKKNIVAAFIAILAFFMAIICLIYFDGYHNYYFESAAQSMRQKYHGATIDINFHWLSNPLFWLIFVATLAMNWIAVFKNLVKKRNLRSGAHLLDN